MIIVQLGGMIFLSIVIDAVGNFLKSCFHVGGGHKVKILIGAQCNCGCDIRYINNRKKGVIYMYYDLLKSNGTIALVQEVSSNGYLVVDRRTDEVLKRACDKDTGVRAYNKIVSEMNESEIEA